MRRYRPLVVVLVGLVLALAATACGGGTGTTAQTSKNGFNPPAPTPGTPNPAYVVQSLDDAIAKATDTLIGQTGEPAAASNITSLSYVQTTAGQAATLLGLSIAPSLASHTAWLFVERGTFRQVGFKNATPGPAKHTLWVLMIQSYTIPLSNLNEATDQPVDLAQLGTPIVIPPGRIPQVDRIRAPVSAAPATPSPPATPTP